MSTSSSSTSFSTASGSSPPPPPSYATSASSSCTTPEPIDEPKPFIIPALDDPRDYTIASLAWQYTRIASALAQLDWTTPAVRAEFKDLASELASRAAKYYPNERPHTPCILSKPEKPNMYYITALARHKMRVAPRMSFEAWKDDEMRMESALQWYRFVAREALALDAALECADVPSSCTASNFVELDTPAARGRKRSVDEVEAESAPRRGLPSLNGKRKRARHEPAHASAAPRRSSRRSVAPQRFGAAMS